MEKINRICIIPARKNSKRIKNKNIKNFLGKPLIYYSIKNALESKLFSKVVVSTDSKKIAKIAKNFGAVVPFLRPKNLSDDKTGTIPVIAHAIKELDLDSSCVVCALYATAPLIDSNDIKNAVKLLESSNADYVFYANEMEKNPLRGFKLESLDSGYGKVELLFSEFSKTRTQDLEKIYLDSGVLYVGKANTFLENKEVFSNKSLALILDNKKAQDIDTKQDFKIAEQKAKKLWKK